MKLCKNCKFCEADLSRTAAEFHDRELEENAKCTNPLADVKTPARIDPVSGRMIGSLVLNDYCTGARSNHNKCGYEGIWFEQK